MKIGIIGTGNIGGALTRRLRSLGHDVKIANSRGPESLAGLAAETGAVAFTPDEAVRDRELVIVTIPENKIPTLKRVFENVPRETVSSTPATTIRSSATDSSRGLKRARRRAVGWSSNLATRW